MPRNAHHCLLFLVCLSSMKQGVPRTTVPTRSLTSIVGQPIEFAHWTKAPSAWLISASSFASNRDHGFLARFLLHLVSRMGCHRSSSCIHSLCAMRSLLSAEKKLTRSLPFGLSLSSLRVCPFQASDLSLSSFGFDKGVVAKAAHRIDDGSRRDGVEARWRPRSCTIGGARAPTRVFV